MLQMQDVQFWLTQGLTNLGYTTLPVFFPGPVDIDSTDINPNGMVVITLTPGLGLDSEELFDRAGVQLRTIGPQMDYNSGEQLSQDCDKVMVGFSMSQEVNGKWWLSVWRVGAPQLLLKDDGDRYNFTGNYIVEVEY